MREEIINDLIEALSPLKKNQAICVVLYRHLGYDPAVCIRQKNGAYLFMERPYSGESGRQVEESFKEEQGLSSQVLCDINVKMKKVIQKIELIDLDYFDSIISCNPNALTIQDILISCSSILKDSGIKTVTTLRLSMQDDSYRLAFFFDNFEISNIFSSHHTPNDLLDKYLMLNNIKYIDLVALEEGIKEIVAKLNEFGCRCFNPEDVYDFNPLTLAIEKL